MARLLAETADLMEIDGADSFRIRSYRVAADAVEQTTVDLASVAGDAARLQEIRRHRQEHGREDPEHRGARLAAAAR